MSKSKGTGPLSQPLSAKQENEQTEAEAENKKRWMDCVFVLVFAFVILTFMLLIPDVIHTCNRMNYC